MAGLPAASDEAAGPAYEHLLEQGEDDEAAPPAPQVVAFFADRTGRGPLDDAADRAAPQPRAGALGERVGVQAPQRCGCGRGWSSAST